MALLYPSEVETNRSCPSVAQVETPADCVAVCRCRWFLPILPQMRKPLRHLPESKASGGILAGPSSRYSSANNQEFVDSLNGGHG